CLGEEARREPTGHVRKANCDSENDGADRGQPRKRAFVDQRREPISFGFGWIVRQLPAPRFDSIRHVVKNALPGAVAENLSSKSKKRTRDLCWTSQILQDAVATRQ